MVLSSVYLSQSTMSINSAFVSDSWLVKIFSRKQATGFCYGVLISDTHVLTSLECEWLLKSDLGSVPRIELANEQLLTPKYNFQKSLPQGPLKAGLMTFELRESVKAYNLSHICPPDELEKVTEEKESSWPLVALEQGCEGEDSRIPGKPETELKNGRVYLRGIRANACSELNGKMAFIDVMAFARWIKVSLIQGRNVKETAIVNGICPLVRTSQNVLSCPEGITLPGFVKVNSKVSLII